jgi:hypothetical protein
MGIIKKGWRYVSNFFSANDKFNYHFLAYFGLHTERQILALWALLLKRKLNAKGVPSTLLSDLKDNGLAVIRDYFDKETLGRIRHVISRIEESNDRESLKAIGVQFKTQDGASYVHLNLTRDMKILPSKELVELVRRYLGLRDLEGLDMWLHGVEDDTSSNRKDINLEWHTDTFHNTVKGFLYIDPLSLADGPFNFFLGSHRFSFRRFWEEFRQSLGSKNVQGFRCADPARIYPMGKNKVCEGLGNAMIVADTFGYHRRGERTTLGKRWSIHFSARVNPFSGSGLVTG